MNKPLCFVLMPFNRKKDPTSGAEIDFNAVYEQLIKPGIVDADMEPLRADEEQVGGIIHKPMFERLVMCDYAVADLTTANANVFYELGVRHGVRPWSTVSLFAKGSSLPFDVSLLRGIPYELSGDAPADPDAGRKALAAALKEARMAKHDSPVFTFIADLPQPQIAREKSDVFREQVQYAQGLKRQLAAARRTGADAVRQVEAGLGNIVDAEAGVVIDLFLSYRATKQWDAMIALAGKMSPPLANSPMVREQLALALNRAGRSDEAEDVLVRLIEERGPSSETNGILGRVYKDRWEAAARANDPAAPGLHRKAIDTYLRGFEADWRDAYPGVNAVTLMELADPRDPRQAKLLPVVAYAVERRIAQGRPDYWDHATRLELAVLARDEAVGREALADALAGVREKWEPETTARNLRLIREARQRRGERGAAWADEAEAALVRRTAA
jgi:hypothetical protein